MHRFLSRTLQNAIIFIAACAVYSGASAQFPSNTPGTGGYVGAVVQTEQVRAELVAQAPDGVAPGSTVTLGLQLTHQPHWHTYWKNPGDSGLPTQLQWTLPAGVTAGEIAWPAPRKIPIGSLANYGFEGTVLLPVPLTIAKDFQPAGLNGDLEVKLFASWLVCRQECVPQEGQFVLRIPTRGSTALNAAAFEAARAALSRLNTGMSTPLRRSSLTMGILMVDGIQSQGVDVSRLLLIAQFAQTRFRICPTLAHFDPYF